MLREKIMSIYEKKGSKAVYPLLFLFFFMLNIVGGSSLSYPATDPNELSVIATADYFTGRNWSGVMVSVDYYYGFLQGLLYVPAVFLFPNAHTQYLAMNVINSMLISIVPMIAFSLSEKLKSGRLWKSLMISLTAGGYCCYFAHSKFAWSETVTIVIPWLMIWLVFKSGEIRGKGKRALVSCAVGALCGLAPAAHSRLIAVILALVVSLIMHRVLFGKKTVNILCFLGTFCLFSLFSLYLTAKIQRELWSCQDPVLLRNTLARFFAEFPDKFADNGLERIVQTVCSQLYYLCASTWGLSAVALCLFAAVVSACIKHKAKKEPQTYEEGLSLFAFFSTFSVLFTLVFSVFYRFSSDSFYTYQDTMMFGRFIDGTVPLMLVFVLMMLFTHSISVNKILGASAVLGVIYVAFMTAAVPVILECRLTRIAPVLGLYPLRVGASSDDLLTADSLMLIMSMTFCVIGILLVVVSCTKKYRSIIISVLISTITVYSLVFISAVYLPKCAKESEVKNSSVVELSERVYDLEGAPAVTAFNISRHDALMLQFLNRNISVRVTYDIESVPENSFLAVGKNEDVSALENSRLPFLLVSESSTLRLYAYGERAAAYMQSQNIDEAELETQRETLIPERTAAPETTAPPEITTASTTAPAASSTTERTPVITTYTTPAVITAPANALGEEDEWAGLE